MNRRRFLALLTGTAASGLVAAHTDLGAVLRELAQPERTYFVGGMAEFPVYTTAADFIPSIWSPTVVRMLAATDVFVEWADRPSSIRYKTGNIITFPTITNLYLRHGG